MDDTWQIKSKNKIHGPFSFSQLLKLVASGRLKRETPIRSGENSIWVAAESVPGLFDAENQSDPADRQPPTLPRDSLSAEWESIPLQQLLPGTSQPSGNAEEPQIPVEATSFRISHRTRFLSSEPKSLKDVFDWRFERYLTPWIVRFTWISILFIAGLAAIYGVTDAAYTLAFDASIVDHLSVLLEGDEPQFRRNAGQRERQFGVEFKPENLGKRRIAAIGELLARLTAIAFTLLYLRVLCEFVIVVFNIASSLRRLEELSEPDRS